MGGVYRGYAAHPAWATNTDHGYKVQNIIIVIRIKIINMAQITQLLLGLKGTIGPYVSAECQMIKSG